MTSTPFADRMAELDAVVEQCRGFPPFTAGVVRDTANRSGRDWPEWGVEIAQTEQDGGERRRVTAGVRLSSNASGEPRLLKAHWRAQIWPGVSVDSFTQWGGRRLEWEVPTPQCLRDTLEALLDEGWAALRLALADRRNWGSATGA